MKAKVLLVEDEADLGNVVKQYLEISDFEVDWLQNGKLAFEKIRKDPRHYQIVLIDVSMPEKCRQAFILSHFEDLSYKAVAHEMGISVKTVEKHISKALRVLRKELNKANYN